MLNKNQPATQRRLRQAHEAGFVPRSRALIHTGSLTALLALLAALGTDAIAGGVDFVRESTHQAIVPTEPAAALEQATSAGLLLLSPTLLLVCVSICATSWLQGRSMVRWPRRTPQRTAPLQNWLDRGFALISFALLLCGGCALLYGQLGAIIRLPRQPMAAAVPRAGELMLGLFWHLVALQLALAAVDLAWRGYAHRRALRMSRDEIRREQQRHQISARVRSALRRRLTNHGADRQDVPR